MCEECRQTPCTKQCPNSEWKPKHSCKACGDSILPNEVYAVYNDEYYHRECFEENAVDILVEEHGAKFYIEEDYDE